MPSVSARKRWNPQHLAWIDLWRTVNGRQEWVEFLSGRWVHPSAILSTPSPDVSPDTARGPADSRVTVTPYRAELRRRANIVVAKLHRPDPAARQSDAVPKRDGRSGAPEVQPLLLGRRTSRPERTASNPERAWTASTARVMVPADCWAGRTNRLDPKGSGRRRRHPATERPAPAGVRRRRPERTVHARPRGSVYRAPWLARAWCVGEGGEIAVTEFEDHRPASNCSSRSCAATRAVSSNRIRSSFAWIAMLRRKVVSRENDSG